MIAGRGKKIPLIIVLVMLGWSIPAAAQVSVEKMQVPARSMSGMSVDAAGVAMDEATVAAGLKEALCFAIDQSIEKCGGQGGFSSAAKLRISLPQKLYSTVENSRKTLAQNKLKALEQQMNTVAEMTASEAAPILYRSVEQLKIPFGIEVLRGENHAATTYLRDHAFRAIKLEFFSLVRRKMVEAGLYQEFCAFVHALKLEDKSGYISYDAVHAHITDSALEGIFSTLEYYENVMRTAPEKLPTPTMRRLFIR